MTLKARPTTTNQMLTECRDEIGRLYGEISRRDGLLEEFMSKLNIAMAEREEAVRAFEEQQTLMRVSVEYAEASARAAEACEQMVFKLEQVLKEYRRKEDGYINGCEEPVNEVHDHE